MFGPIVLVGLARSRITFADPDEVSLLGRGVIPFALLL